MNASLLPLQLLLGSLIIVLLPIATVISSSSWWYNKNNLHEVVVTNGVVFVHAFPGLVPPSKKNQWGRRARRSTSTSWSSQERRPRPRGGSTSVSRQRPIPPRQDDMDDFDFNDYTNYNDDDDNFNNNNNNNNSFYYQSQTPRQPPYNKDSTMRRTIMTPPPLSSSSFNYGDNNKNYDVFDMQQRQYRQSTFRRDPWWPQQKQPSQQQQQRQQLRLNNYNNQAQKPMMQQKSSSQNVVIGYNTDIDWGFVDNDDMQGSSFYNYNNDDDDDDDDDDKRFGRRQGPPRGDGQIIRRRERNNNSNNNNYVDFGDNKKKQYNNNYYYDYTEDFRRGAGSTTSFLSTPPSWSLERTIPNPSSFRRRGLSSSSSSSSSSSNDIIVGEQYTPDFRRGFKPFNNKYDGDVEYDERVDIFENDTEENDIWEWQSYPPLSDQGQRREKEEEEEREWQRQGNQKNNYYYSNNNFRYYPQPPIPPTTQPPPSSSSSSSKRPQQQQNQYRGIDSILRDSNGANDYYRERELPTGGSLLGGIGQQRSLASSTNGRERDRGIFNEQQQQQQQQQIKSQTGNSNDFAPGNKSTRIGGAKNQYNPQSQPQQYSKDTPPRSKMNTSISNSSRESDPNFGNGGIKRMINKLFEPYSVFGADKMTKNRVDLELTRSLDDEKKRMKSILTDARKNLLANPAVRNVFGSDLELGTPISKTSSSTMVNGMTRSRLQLVIPITGSSSSSSGETGRIRIVANQDGLSQLECDVGGRIIDIPLDKKGGPEDRVIDARVVDREMR